LSARRKWAWPLVPVYAAGQSVKDALRAMGVLKVKSLEWPVVSVGSLSAGGAGKTPVVIALAKLLRERGWDVDVLSRGYGRAGKGVEMVAGVDDGVASAARFGDEPVLIARSTDVPVWVGSDRFAAGKRAEKFVAGERKADPAHGVHILDDGFQHRRLARKVDLVLVTTEDLDDSLLPAGNLRERRTALLRADVVVVRDRELKRVAPRLRAFIHSEVTIWCVRRTLRFPEALGVLSAGLRPMAFCAIARPEGFATMLRDAGCGIVDTMAFADHHPFTASDIGQLIEVATKRRATGFMTTEKDAVRLTAALREQLEKIGPVVVVGLDVEFNDATSVMHDLETRLK
jgi:tetraacyldisaccharide 4'-kinase